MWFSASALSVSRNSSTSSFIVSACLNVRNASKSEKNRATLIMLNNIQVAALLVAGFLCTFTIASICGSKIEGWNFAVALC